MRQGTCHSTGVGHQKPPELPESWPQPHRLVMLRLLFVRCWSHEELPLTPRAGVCRAFLGEFGFVEKLASNLEWKVQAGTTWSCLFESLRPLGPQYLSYLLLISQNMLDEVNGTRDDFIEDRRAIGPGSDTSANLKTFYETCKKANSAAVNFTCSRPSSGHKLQKFLTSSLENLLKANVTICALHNQLAESFNHASPHSDPSASMAGSKSSFCGSMKLVHSRACASASDPGECRLR
jgi:hypothetical protein